MISLTVGKRAALRLQDAVVDRVSRFPWRPNGYTVDWFTSWEPVLDEALASLPALRGCDHDAIRLLCEESETPKRVALVMFEQNPVALIPLRRRSAPWEVVTTGCLPWALFPATPGHAARAISTLGLVVLFQECEESISDLSLSTSWVEPRYRLDLSTDFQAYWKSSSLGKDLRRTRNRTRGLDVRVDEASDINWVVNEWAMRFQDDPHGWHLLATDRIRIFNYLAQQGKTLTVTLLHEGRPVAGQVALVNDDEVGYGAVARVVDHPIKSLGNRVNEEAVRIAADRGFRYFNFGVGHDYKHRWAPADGDAYGGTVLPPTIRYSRKAVRWLRGLESRFPPH